MPYHTLDPSQAIERILEAKGLLVKRSREQLEIEIENFIVIERDEKIIACAALYSNPDNQTGELACLAVNEDYKGGERGDRLLRHISQKAVQQKLTQLLVLTTQSTEYVPKERHQHYENGRAVPGPQSPQDILGTVAFLLTEDALTLTGQVLPVNRGFVFK